MRRGMNWREGGDKRWLGERWPGGREEWKACNMSTEAFTMASFESPRPEETDLGVVVSWGWVVLW